MPRVKRSAPVAQLTTELEQLAMRALAEDYDRLNTTLFDGLLQRPGLYLSDTRVRLGQWESNPPAINLARHLLTEQPWPSVLEVLKHEMAHQFVSEVMRVTEPAAHGPLFRRICEERGIDARASGEVSHSGSDTHVISKISHLLSLAQSGNQHEAEAAMAAAQRLMLKYNIDSLSRAERRQFTIAHLGKATGRVEEASRIVSAILREFFFVQTIWVSVWRPLEGKAGSVLEICGTRANVEMAQYVHSFLEHSAEQLWKAHQRAANIRGNRDRRRFLAGVMSGFHRKLLKERGPARQAGLVWLGDPQLQEYFRQRYPRTRTIHYGSSSGTSAHAAGERAGERLVLHRGVGQGPSSSVKLLS